MERKKCVLYVGIAPENLEENDLINFPGLTPEKVRQGIDETVQQFFELNIDCITCMVEKHPGKAAQQIRESLQSMAVGPDVVLIGGGIRVPPPHLILFEHCLNAIHEFSPPSAKICFNTGTHNNLEAVQRYLK